MDSPIFRLTQVLEQVRATAQEYKEVLPRSEAATRAALIDPVLRALGWDVADPRRVEVEKTQNIQGNERIDYALQADGDYKFAVEAKKLNGNLRDHFNQLAAYSMSLRVRDLFITDGVRWHHYQNIGHDNQTPVKELDLLNEELPKVAAYLIQHLDAALFVTESPVEDRLEELRKKFDALKSKTESLESVTKNLLRFVNKGTGDSPPAPPLPLPPPTGEGLSERNEYTNTKPNSVQLPNGDTKSVSTWKDVLVECCRFALITHPALLNHIPLRDKAAGKIFLIQEIKPASSSSYAPITIEDKTLWVHTTYSAQTAVANCLYIIEKVPGELRKNPVSVILSKKE
jgi:hypothetical protein